MHTFTACVCCTRSVHGWNLCDTPGGLHSDKAKCLCHLCDVIYSCKNTPTPRYVRANDKIRQIHSGHFYLKPTRENSNGGYKTCMENVARRSLYIFVSWVHEHWTEEKSEWKKGHKRLLIPQNSTYLTSPLRTERIRNGLYVGIEVL